MNCIPFSKYYKYIFESILLNIITDLMVHCDVIESRQVSGIGLLIWHSVQLEDAIQTIDDHENYSDETVEK